MADTQIDELRLDITVEDKTSGESSDKKVKNLATAISRLNKNLQAFDNAKFTKVFDNMSKGIDPFVKKIEKVSNALVSLATIVSKGGLDKAVKEVTGKVPELKTETYSDGDRKSEPVQAVQGQAEELQETTNKAKSFGSSILDITNKADILRKKLEMINAEMQKSGLSEKQLIQLKSQQLSIQEQIAKAEGKKPKVPLSNLLKSFGRIAMYRAVRRTIQEITQAFMESIDGIAKYNSEFRDTMGSLQSSMAKAKASIGVAFYQVLIMLEPLITQIVNGIANLANSLAKVTANMRGVANYTKINTEYMKEYQSATQGALLAFDTFTTLGSKEQYDPSKMFTTETDALDTESFSEAEKTIKNMLSAFNEMLEIIKNLYYAIEPIISIFINDILPPLSEILRILSEIIGEIVEFLMPAIEKVAGLIKFNLNIISGGLKILTGDFQGGMKQIYKEVLPLGQKITELFGNIKAVIKTIGSTTKQVFTEIGDWIKQLFHNIAQFFTNLYNNTIGKLVEGVKGLFEGFRNFGKGVKQTGGVIGSWVRGAFDKVKGFFGFADGGMMDNASFSGAGTMYALAGESGAEVVATGSAGTGVLNVDQFADAMVSALVRYGAARDTSNGTTIVLDGNKVGQLVASNVGFRNEANRRNAGLNWK